MLKVFLDANIYFSGSVSSEGASYLVLEMTRRKKIIVYSSKLVLREAERNLRLKSTPENLKSFHGYLQKTKIHVIPAPEEKNLQGLEALIHPKDLPVLGAALAAKTDYFLTLDKKHFLTSLLQSKIKQPKILTPGDFIRQIYLKGKI
ncbi:MAG: PIN domain-containing protein [Candidatus Omnitrophica bacterium]|nr:PIN domain-containing protein [Candidatus Omnitrophota bacterium]